MELIVQFLVNVIIISVMVIIAKTDIRVLFPQIFFREVSNKIKANLKKCDGKSYFN